MFFSSGKNVKFVVGTITLRDSVAGKEVPLQIKLGDQITTVIEGSEVPVTEDIPIYRYDQEFVWAIADDINTSAILYLTVECQEVDGQNYKIYINGKLHAEVALGGFVPDQYKVEMVGTTDTNGVWKGQANWFQIQFR